jgi:putative spermidine/putrescine transport system permease protein
MRQGTIWRWVIGSLVLLYLVFPLFVIVPVSFSSASYLQFPPPGYSLQWYAKYLNRPDWLDSTFRSFWIAFGTMLFATTLGTAAAFALVRGNFPGKRLVNALILSPLIMPGIVAAIAIYFFYAKLNLVDTPLGLVLAHSTQSVPYVVILVTAALRGFDGRLEQAAMNLGANYWLTFWHVTLPIIWPGVLAGGIFAFIASWDELIISMFITSTKAVTLPVRMWESVRNETDPTIAAVATLMVVVSVAAMSIAELFQRRARKVGGTGASQLDTFNDR